MNAKNRFCACLVATVALSLGLPGVAVADFGLLPGSLNATALNRDGTFTTQAGAHPYSYEINFALKTGADGKTEGGEARSVVIDLPAGLVGDPEAVPQCRRPQFEGNGQPHCPPETQIGVLYPIISIGLVAGPIYNLVPPPGVAAQIGFSLAAHDSLQNASIRTEEGYGVSADAFDLPIEVRSVKALIWGTPADPAHDAERGPAAGTQGEVTPSSAPQTPFLTMPTSCEAPPVIAVRADSRLTPDVWSEISAVQLDAGGSPVALSGCEAVPFAPEVTVLPTTRLAENPTGLDFELKLPDQGLLAPGEIAESQPERVEVALPEGVTANPSVAEGIATCSEAQYHAQGPNSVAGEGCPEASKLGSIVASTPLLSEPIEGALYLATPYRNPTGTLIGLYIVAKAGERGVMIKQAGSVTPDPQTGQLVAVFEGLPPLPYSDFKLHFREGPRSALASPAICGTYTTSARLAPFSSPTHAYTSSSTFAIDHGTGGGACPSTGAPPFAPGLTAGTLNNAAGSFSQLYMRLERHDGEQEITGFATQLPAGLSGNLSGIPECGQPEIQRAREQTGAEAETSSACPAGSQIGHTLAEAGVGTVLAQTPGKLYLAGPFEGAPFSVVDVTSAKVGPFDLGTVVVHLPLQIDPNTAQVSIPAGPADQIPHIIKGIVIHLRAIRVYVDRSGFIFNPTNCEPASIQTTVIGAGRDFASPADDTQALASTRFQAAECGSLSFKPAFQASTGAKTSRTEGASLTVKLAPPAQGPQNQSGHEEANIHAVKVELPKQLPARLTTLQKACTAQQFHTNPAGCPAPSVVGHARAITPILPVPLEGPAYFVSNGGEAFPNLVMVLQGDGIRIDLTGDTFISKAGITSSTFKTVPDQPVTNFELTLPQGPYSALAANGNLCTQTLTMPTSFTGQNGATVSQETPIQVSGCPNTITVLSKQHQGHTLTLHVSVPAAGTLKATGTGLSAANGKSKGRATIVLRLRTKRTGRFTSKIKLTFTPAKGKPIHKNLTAKT